MSELEISLAEARVKAGLSKEAVADKMKVSGTVVEEWEAGTRDLTIDQARKLSRLYGLSVDCIFFG